MSLRCCLIYKNGGDGIQMLQSSAGNDISYCTIADNTGDGIELYNDVSFAGHRIVGNQIANNGGYGINLYSLSQFVMYTAEGNNIYNNASGAASVTIDAWPYTTYNPQFVSTTAGSEDYRIKASLYGGFPETSNGMLPGAATVYNGWPSLDNVYDDDVDGVAGTLTLPTVAQVLYDVLYGPGGDSFAGSYHSPATADVKDGVTYGPDNTYEGEYVGAGGGGGLRGGANKRGGKQ